MPTSTQLFPAPIREVQTPPLERLQALAIYLAENVISAKPEGFTADPRHLTLLELGVDDYIVSIRGHERQFAQPPGFSEVLAWVLGNRSALWLPGCYAGGWSNPKTRVYSLDVSVPVTGLFLARRFGRVNGQRSIYRPHTGETIWLDSPDDHSGVTGGAPSLQGLEVER